MGLGLSEVRKLDTHTGAACFHYFSITGWQSGADGCVNHQRIPMGWSSVDGGPPKKRHQTRGLGKTPKLMSKAEKKQERQEHLNSLRRQQKEQEWQEKVVCQRAHEYDLACG
jgi:hypothetical protein